MSMFADITIDSILADIDSKIKELKESENANQDTIKGLELARKIIASHY